MVDATADTAMPLMYAAKKYLLTGLVKECQTVIEKGLSVDTVCTVLKQSMSLQENELKQKCLQFVTINALRVFNAETFLHLSREALRDVVCLNCLFYPTERQVYEYCMKWARRQLRETGNECPSDEEIRDKLGDVLYKIRFPVMTLKDFAELTAQSTVVNAEEKHDVYVFMALGKKLETLKFVDERRRGEEKVINRFNNVRSLSLGCKGKTDAISIHATVGMHLTGVGLYGGREASTHNVTVKVLKESETLSMTVSQMTSDGRQDPIKVELENPVYIHANTTYTVAVVILGPNTWAGTEGGATCEFPESGSIAFDNSEMSNNSTTVSSGQIPQLFDCF